MQLHLIYFSSLIHSRVVLSNVTSLPSFRFVIPEAEYDVIIQSLKMEMATLFNKPEHSRVAACVGQYGSSNVVTDNGRSNLEKGIDRLCKHFQSILNFFDNQFVFAVVLDNMSYGDRHPDVSRTESADPIKDLRSEIPRTYLHVPAGFDFRIGSSSMNREKIIFDYWPQRLVELSSFSVNINENVPWHRTADAGVGYNLRVFAGFDRMRINSPDEVKSASIYVYSCRSGRLIKYEPDARFILGLNASGSMYCSGLTILVDDIDGKLPLNPTKQDIAFGEQTNGQAHKENLFAWLGAVTKFFYDHHLAKFDNKKMELTQKIKQFGPELTNSRMKVIDRCQLTTFDVRFSFYGSKSIRINRNSREIAGIDTRFLLIPEKPVAQEQTSSQQQNHPCHFHSVQPFKPIARQVPAPTYTNAVLQPTCQYRGSQVPENIHSVQHFGRQGQTPMNNDNAELLVESSHARIYLKQKERAFQVAVNGHRDDVVRLMTMSAARGASVSAEDVRSARFKNLNEIRRANFLLHQAGGKKLTEDELTSLIEKVEQEAIKMYRLLPKNAPVDDVYSNMDLHDDNPADVNASDDHDDTNSVSSTKSYYKDLCIKLTDTLEERNGEIKDLKKEILELKTA